MNAKKNRLGRGLDALLGEVRKEPAEGEAAVEIQTDDGKADKADAPVVTTHQGAASPYKHIDVDLLDTGQYQPRTKMDDQALDELAASIKAQGLIQPILVRTKSAGRYEILAGHRRWQACVRAGLQSVPAVVKTISDQAALAVALIENIQREDLNPIEEAMGLKRLMSEFGATHEQIAAQIGRSRTAVTNLLRLLNLSPKVRQMVEAGELDMGHAKVLLPLSEAEQLSLAKIVVAQNLTVRATEQKVKQLQDPQPSSRLDHLRKDADVLRLETELSDKLAAKVSIVQGNKKGKLVIEYHGLDELDGILQRIK